MSEKSHRGTAPRAGRGRSEGAKERRSDGNRKRNSLGKELSDAPAFLPSCIHLQVVDPGHRLLVVFRLQAVSADDILLVFVLFSHGHQSQGKSAEAVNESGIRAVAEVDHGVNSVREEEKKRGREEEREEEEEDEEEKMEGRRLEKRHRGKVPVHIEWPRNGGTAPPLSFLSPPALSLPSRPYLLLDWLDL